MINDTITVPFNTHSPKSEINPTPAEILRGIPLKESATIPHVALHYDTAVSVLAADLGVSLFNENIRQLC